MYKKTAAKLMGNRFEFTVKGDNDRQCDQYIQLAIDEISRIENKLSTYKEESETNLINAHAGIKPVRVSQETFELIKRSIRISNLTQGAFDITYGSIDKRFWNFDTQMESLPDPLEAKKSVHLINYQNIVLDEQYQMVFLKNKGMRICFGGIGKGYAADRAKKILMNEGVEAGIVNASGDLTTWGKPEDADKWTIE